MLGDLFLVHITESFPNLPQPSHLLSHFQRQDGARPKVTGDSRRATSLLLEILDVSDKFQRHFNFTEQKENLYSDLSRTLYSCHYSVPGSPDTWMITQIITVPVTLKRSPVFYLALEIARKTVQSSHE